MSERAPHGRERHRTITLPGDASAEAWLQRRGERIEMHHSFKSPDSSSGGGGGAYAVCAQGGCVGEAIPLTGHCFKHSSREARVSLLQQIPGSNHALSLRGTSISQELWDEIAKSPMFNGGVLRAPILLSGAEISARIRMEGITFAHYVDLSSASVFEHIELRDCTFKASLVAKYAIFDGGALNCHGSTLEKDVDISFATVDRVSLGFQECSFRGSVNATGLDGAIHLDRSEIRGNLTCKHSRAFLILNACEVHGSLDVSRSDLKALHGERLISHSTLQIGPCTMAALHLPRAVFNSRVHVDVVASQLNLTGAVLNQGGLIVVDKATIRLGQVSLGGPLRLSGKSDSENQPEVVDLLNSDIGAMSLSRVNLSRCSFHGTHGLGTVDIEATCTFRRSPWWAGRRRFIADEYAWRKGAGGFHSFGWDLDGTHVGTALPKPTRGTPEPVLLAPLNTSQVSSVYRELRRSLESKSDMPGAADFYFGEMEMRRWGGSRSYLERLLVWSYWLLCGYGLRPARALGTWVLMVVGGAICLYKFGLSTSPSVSQALLVALRASIPGFVSTPGLTQEGQWIETILRVLGTLLIALFLLSVRSLVMRKPSE